MGAGMEDKAHRGKEPRVGRPLPADRIDAPTCAGVSRADAWGLWPLHEARILRAALDSRLRGNDIGEARMTLVEG